MKKFIIGFCLIIAALVANTALAAPPAQDTEGETYVVQANDWLSKIADKFYGDVLAYPTIVEATNAKAAEDNSYAVIDNPDLIEVGQKLWIPSEGMTASATTSTATDTIPAPTDNRFAGVYTAQMAAAASPGREVTLTLNEDGSVERSTDYLNGEDPIVENGTWTENEDGSITITLTGRPDGVTYDEPDVITFALDGTTLTATEYDTSRYGSEGLTLEKQTIDAEATAEPTPEPVMSDVTTEVINYLPEVPATSQDGSCWTHSIAVSGSPFAWRCMVGNAISDPCLTAIDGETIVCGVPDPANEFAINLTEPLPDEDVSDQPVRPWQFELEGGATCGALTGTLPPVEEDIYFGCTQDLYIIGDLQQEGATWYATTGMLEENPEGPLPFKVANQTQTPVLKLWLAGDPTQP